MNHADREMPAGKDRTPRSIPEPQAGRRPWVTPALERLDLRDAMAVTGGNGFFDGVGSS